MPNSQFDTAAREDADTIHLTGPVEGVPADALVRLQATVTQDAGFAAAADQVISEPALRAGRPPGFEVRATRTSSVALDPNAPLRVEGTLTARAPGASAEETFRWVDHFDAEPASGTASSPGWRRRPR